MKVLIVEEALKTLHGHWFQYVSDLVAGGQAAGHHIEVAVHREAMPEVVAAMPCHPILRRSVFDPKTQPDRFWRSLKRLLGHNLQLYRALSRFLSSHPDFDVVIAPSVRLDHLLAYGLLRWRFRRRANLRWVLIFIDAVGEYSADYSLLHFSRKLLPFRFALKAVRASDRRRRLVFATESKEMARRFRLFSGCEFAVLPHVTYQPDLAPFRDSPPLGVTLSPTTIILGTFGFTRHSKGEDVLQEAIRHLLDTGQYGEDLLFVLQWTGDYQFPDGTWARKDAVLEHTDAVHYLPSFARSNEFYEWLARTDIMILPYRKEFYYDRLSRVAIDAAIAGIPLVYPRGTWLEDFVREHGAGVSFEAEDVPSLEASIKEAMSNLSRLKAEAAPRQSSTREAFCAARFFSNIAELRDRWNP